MRFFIRDEHKISRQKKTENVDADKPLHVKNKSMMRSYCLERGQPATAYTRATSYLTKRTA